MEVSLLLNMLTYQDGQFQTLLRNPKFQKYHLPKIEVHTAIIPEITAYLKTNFDIDIKSDQITLHDIMQTNNKNATTIVIPALIVTDVHQTQIINQHLEDDTTWIWVSINKLPAQLEKPEIVHDALNTLKNKFLLTDLYGIHWLLPETFTTKFVSNMLTQLTGSYVERNNIKRRFSSELHVVGKDHSKRGRATTIFKYQPSKKSSSK